MPKDVQSDKQTKKKITNGKSIRPPGSVYYFCRRDRRLGHGVRVLHDLYHAPDAKRNGRQHEEEDDDDDGDGVVGLDHCVGVSVSVCRNVTFDSVGLGMVTVIGGMLLDPKNCDNSIGVSRIPQRPITNTTAMTVQSIAELVPQLTDTQKKTDPKAKNKV